MIVIARLTILGMYKFDDSLFDNLKLPEGLDKSTVVNQILLDSTPFEVLYADFDTMKELIGLWSDTWARTFEKWVNVFSLEYNPIENYDRMESWTDSANRSGQSQRTESRDYSTQLNVNASSNDTTANTGGDSTTHKVSAYDSNDYSNDSLDTVELNNQSVTNGHNQNQTNGRDSGATSTVGNDVNVDNSKHEGRMHGNIGVTTTQQMMHEEIQIARFNLTKQISDIFIQEFCVMVY